MYRIINMLLLFIRAGIVTRLIYLTLIWIVDESKKEESVAKGKNAVIMYIFAEGAIELSSLVLDYF